MTGASHLRWTRLARDAAIGGVLLALFTAAALYLTSDAFRDRVRRKLIAELELLTGGRVELKAFRWDLSRLEFEADDLTIHGLEPPGEVPYAHVDRLLVRLKIFSLWRREIGLRRVMVERPVAHIIVFPDGSTSQPVPKIKRESQRSPVDRLFDLAIDDLEVAGGQLLWNDKRIPLDFSGNGVTAGMTYAMLQKRYDGEIHIGSIMARLKDSRPVESRLEVRFSLGADAAELKALKLASARSSLEASGLMSHYLDPRIDLTYNASLDLGELGRSLGMRPMRNGRLDAQGQGHYTSKDFSSAGRLFLHNFEWIAPGLRLAGIQGGSQFSLTPERISLSGMNAQAFGGMIRGEADVRNWAGATPVAGKRPAPATRQQGSAVFHIRDVRIGEVAAAISSASLPLGRARLTGTVSGQVGMVWKDSPAKSEISVALDANPPAQPAPEELPVNARARLIYRAASGQLDVSELDLATRFSRLNAAGMVGSESGKLKVALNTTDLSEFQPLLAAYRPGTQMPIDLHGRGSFTGTISGTRLGGPALRGHLEMSGFDSLVPVTTAQAGAMPGPAARRVRWDLLRADIEYSPAGASIQNGRLQRGAAQIGFQGRAALRQGRFDSSTPFSATLNARHADLAEALSLAGYNYPVSGTVNLGLRVAGTEADPRGDGRLEISDGSVYGESFKLLRTDIRFVNHEAQLANILLQHNGGQVTGSAAYNLTHQGYRFDLHGANFDLAKLKLAQSPRLSVAGAAEFTARGSGTLEAPVIDASARARNLVLNGESAGNLELNLATRGTELRVAARSNFENAELRLDGNVHLRGSFPAQMTLRFSHLDVDPLIRAYFKGRITGHSSIGGNVALNGPLRQPKALSLVADLEQFSADVENIKLANQGPIRFSLANQTARVDALRLVGDGTDISASGTAQLQASGALDLRADGGINLKLLQSLNPDVLSYGTAKLAISVSGTMKQPALSGQLTVADAGISFIDLPNGLSNINGTLAFNQDRLQVQSLTAHTGGGTLNIGGAISYRNGLFFNLTATGNEVRLRYPPGVSASANADLRLTGSAKNALLAGDVLVTRFGLNPKFDFALYLARSNQPPVTPKPNTLLDNLRLDVHVLSTPQLRVETSLAKVAGDADLRLRGTATHPTVLGRVNIAEGDMFFNGTKYHLERGDITFTNPVRIEPVMDMEASARVREYDITLGFHGSIDKLSTTYRSDPPLPTADIIALLALGRTREESAAAQQQQSTQTLTETASNAILGQALNSSVSSRVQKLFGVSRIKIDPQVGGPQNTANARLTIEQEVSNNVTLTYITNLAQSAQQVIQIEINLSREVSLVGVRDQNGVLGFDVKIRKRKR